MRVKGKKCLAAALASVVTLTQVPLEVLATDIEPPATYLVEITEQTFPDAVLREYVTELEMDSSIGNGDGYIAVSEWNNFPTEFDLSHTDGKDKITDLTGIQYFTKLETLTINGNELESINLNKLTLLKELKAAGNKLNSVTINKCTVLESLDVSQNKLSALTVSGQALKVLNISENEFSVHDLTKYPVLEELRAGGNQLDDLNTSTNPLLKVVEVQKNELTEIDFSNNPGLTLVNASENQLESINISASPNITTLDVSDNELTELDVSTHTYLKNLNCQDNKLGSLNTVLSSGLETLHAGNNRLPYVTVYNQGQNITELTLGQQTITAAAVSDTGVAGGRKVVPGFPDADFVSNVRCQDGNVTYRAADRAFVFTDVVAGFSYQYNLPGKPASAAMEVKAALEGVAITASNFPDPAFRTYVAEAVDDGSGYLTEAELQGVRDIVLANAGVSNLSGIELFTELESLTVTGNKLVSISIGSNKKLKKLEVGNNALTSLTISKNTALEEIDCSQNQIAKLDVSKHTALKKLNVSGNQLEQIDVSANTALTDLNVGSNQLTGIDVSSNASLARLDVSVNLLGSLDVTANHSLASLLCDGNRIPYIKAYNSGSGLTGDVELGTQQVQGTPAASGNGRYVDKVPAAYASMLGIAAASKGAVWLDQSGCEGKFYFEELLSEFTYEYMMNGNTMTVVTGITEAAVNEARFPDAAFRAYVAESLDTDGNGYLNEIEISAVTEIQAAGLGISDLTGLNLFPALEALDVSDNVLTAIDISGNLSLKVLNAGKNQLADGSLTGLSDCRLTELYVNDNQLAELDLTANTALEVLNLSGNGFQALSLEKNKALKELKAARNRLTSLDVNKFTGLTVLYAAENQISSLDLTKNAKLEMLDVSDNSLSTLNVSKNIKLTELKASGNELTKMALGEGFTGLSVLALADNGFTELDVTGLGNLTVLDFHENEINAIDLTANTKMKELNVSGNQLAELTVNTLSALEKLKCGENRLTALDVSASTGLKELSCAGNKLPYITGVAQSVTDPALGSQEVQGRAGAKTGEPGTWEVKMPGMPQNLRSTVTDLNAGTVSFNSASGSFYITAELPDFSYTISIAGNNMEVTFAARVININETAFPDDNFRAYVSSTKVDTDQNGYLNDDEMEAVKTMEMRGLGIESLEGIALFTELISLDCSFNSLTNLDISGNEKLESLYCKNNKIKALDLSKNEALTKVYASNNKMTTLVTEGCSILSFLSIENNALTTLELKTNTALSYLNCSNNSLEKLETTTLTDLSELYCTQNALTVLTVHKNLKLEVLAAEDNSLTSINVSKNPKLLKLLLSGQMAEDGGTLTELNVSGNPLLKHLDVSDNGLLELNLTGNEKLTALSASNNSLNELDLSANILLETLAVTGNSLTGLTLSAAPELTVLTCADNQLTELDLSGNEKLTEVDCGGNQLTGLITENLTELKKLSVSENQLESLNLTDNSQITELYCQKNNLTELDLTAQTGLLKLVCGENHLKQIRMSEQVTAGNNNISFGHQQVTGEAARNRDGTAWQTELRTDQNIREELSVGAEEGIYDPDTDTVTYERMKESITYTHTTGGYQMEVEVQIKDYESLMPVVDLVEITPDSNIRLKKGEKIAFGAVVTGSNYPNEEVNWSVAGAVSSGTWISKGGALKVGSDETAAVLTVTARSVEDGTVSAGVKVDVVTLEPVVKGVSISTSGTGKKTSRVYLLKGQQQSLYGTVSGSNLTDTSVVWSVSGNKKNTTRIDSRGVLKIGSKETASTLTVTAVSKADKTKKASIKVTVRSAPHAKGKKITSDKGQYKVTKAATIAEGVYKEGTVTFTKTLNKKATTISVPDTIKVDGVPYKVTEIGAKALKNHKKITILNIGSNVKKIGTQAFYGCKKLKLVRISSKLLKTKSIGKKAFGKNKKSMTVAAPAAKRKSYKKLLKKAGVPATAKYSKK